MDVPAKANRILTFVSIGFFLIALRVVYLTLFEYESMQEKSKLPKRRIEYSVGPRGTIRDRFGIPLAVNHIQYDATILYSRVKDLPRIRFTYENGKRVKHYPRKNHIHTIATLLSERLHLDAQEIEDKIYSEAALFPNTPCVIASGIDEKTYYALKFLEHSYPGIYAKETSTRTYPMGSVAGDIIGFLGALNAKDKQVLQDKIDALETYLEAYATSEPLPLPEGYISLREVEEGLAELKEKAYAQSGSIGKAGIEYTFDKELRGGIGYTHYEVDTTGKRVKELPFKKKAAPGKQVQLTLSYELQSYAEDLLAKHEAIRDKEFATYGKEHETIDNPWIKGGALVAMIPDTGEIVALASYPRLDPTVFAQKDAANIHAQLETAAHICNIYSGKVPLQRERIVKGKRVKESAFLTWESYLNKVIAPQSSVHNGLQKVRSLRSAKQLYKAVHSLLDLSEQPSVAALIDALYTPKDGMQLSRKGVSQKLKETLLNSLNNHPEARDQWKKVLDVYLCSIPCNDDKLLLLDLIRLPIDVEAVKDEFLLDIPLATFFTATQQLAQLSSTLQKESTSHFHTRIFSKWREKEFPAYLKEKRLQEKEEGKYQKPYTYYLRAAERKLFHAFWEEQKIDALLSVFFDEHPFVLKKELSQKNKPKELEYVLRNATNPCDLISLLRPLNTLTKPLHGAYRTLHPHRATQQDLAKAFYPRHGYFFGKSLSYQHAAQQGSLFKVVTAYEALMERYAKGHVSSLNPLTLVDEIGGAKDPFKGLMLGYTMDGKPIYRRHMGGTLPRSHGNIGKVDLLTAMERSSNIYFSILAGDVIESPATLYRTAALFGFGTKTGIELPHEYKGMLPYDLRFNKTGLYQFAIGQHTLTVTPLQSAQMFATIANKGIHKAPSIVKQLKGEESLQSDPLSKEAYPYKEILANAHLYFPLFTQSVKEQKGLDIQTIIGEEEARFTMPDEVHDYLLESLRRVVHTKKGSAHPFRVRGLYRDHTVLSDYVKTKPHMVGKTSTAEYYLCPHLNTDTPPVRVKDIWFGGISYKDPIPHSNSVVKERFKDPELVVISYLRCGDYGKEAAPLAAQVMKKWKEIKQRHEETSY